MTTNTTTLQGLEGKTAVFLSATRQGTVPDRKLRTTAPNGVHTTSCPCGVATLSLPIATVSVVTRSTRAVVGIGVLSNVRSTLDAAHLGAQDETPLRGVVGIGEIVQTTFVVNVDLNLSATFLAGVEASLCIVDAVWSVPELTVVIGVRLGTNDSHLFVPYQPT